METIYSEKSFVCAQRNDSNFSISTVKMFTCLILQRSSTAFPVRKVMEVTLFCNKQVK